MSNKEVAKREIKIMPFKDIDKLNNIANKYGISLLLAQFLYSATH